MIWLARLLWYFAGQYLQGRMVKRAKRQGLIAYMRALQGTRQVVIATVLLFFLFHVIVLAGFGALITGLLLLDYELTTVLKVLFVAFATLFTLPVVALIVALNERVWYRFSGAQKLVEEIAEGEASKAA